MHLHLLSLVFVTAAVLGRETAGQTLPSDICPLSRPRLLQNAQGLSTSEDDAACPRRTSSWAAQTGQKPGWKDTGMCVAQYCLSVNRAFSDGRGIAVISTAGSLDAIKAALNRSRGRDEDASREEGRFSTAEIPGKGLGLVARRPMRRGDRLMSQAPVLLVHRGFLEDALPPEGQRRLLEAAVSRLPPSTRGLFLSQATRHPSMKRTTTTMDSGDRVADILATNSFQIDVGGGGDDGHHYGSFPEAARFNHDCRPNVAFYVDPLTLTHVTTAARSVREGDELTVSYLDLTEPRALRRERARRAWGFECGCARCRGGGPESDQRLAERARLEAALSDLRGVGGDDDSGSPDKVTAALVRRFVELHAEEGLEAAMAGAYALAALNANLLGEAALAVEYAEKAIEAGLIESGPGAADVEAMRELRRDPRGHFTWRKRVDR